MDASLTTTFTWIIIAYFYTFLTSTCKSYTYTSLNCNFTNSECGWTDTNKTNRTYKWKHMYDRMMSLTGNSKENSKTSRLQSVQFSTSIDLCLIFTYNIELVNNNWSGILKIYLNNTEYEQELTFRSLSVTIKDWKQGSIDLSINRTTNYTIVFEGRQTNNGWSNISIDSVAMHPGFCSENNSAETTISHIQTTNNDADTDQDDVTSFIHLQTTNKDEVNVVSRSNSKDGGLIGGLVIGVLIVILIIAFVVYKQRNSCILQCKPKARSPELILTTNHEQSVANVEDNKTSLSQHKKVTVMTTTLNKQLENEKAGLTSDANVYSTEECNAKVHDETAENSYVLFDDGQYNTLNGVLYMKNSETPQNVYSHTLDNVYDVAGKRRINDTVDCSINNVYNIASKDRNTENVQYSMFP